MKGLLLISFLFLITSGYAQSTFTLKYFGMTIHPFGDRTAQLQPFKLDEKARFVANFGGFVGFEKFVYKDLLSVKFIQGLFTDCSGGLKSVSHIGMRGLMFENHKNRFYLGVGPTMMIRESWTRFGTDYESSGYFNVRETRNFGVIQHKFILYGLEFEYDRLINEKNNLSISFTPGIPMAMILSVGWKHWFNHPNFDYNRPAIPGS